MWELKQSATSCVLDIPGSWQIFQPEPEEVVGFDTSLCCFCRGLGECSAFREGQAAELSFHSALECSNGADPRLVLLLVET